MRTLGRDEAGFTLIEVLVVCVLMLIVLTATLTTFDSFQSNAEKNTRQNDAQDEVRRTVDQLARDLRNLASPQDYDPKAIKRKEDNDLIVQSVGDVRPSGSNNVRNIEYVRYCYDVAGRRLMRQRLTWTGSADPGYPNDPACPAGGWGQTQVVGNDVVNGTTRPVFTYNNADPLQVTEIHTSLWVDVNPGSLPRETPLATTVFLRNQNRQPVARFTPAREGTSIVLNGSASQDPEERALTYEWYELTPTRKLVGTGIVYVYSSATPGNHTFELTVRDQASLSNTSEPETVCVPGGTIKC